MAPSCNQSARLFQSVTLAPASYSFLLGTVHKRYTFGTLSLPLLLCTSRHVYVAAKCVSQRLLSRKLVSCLLAFLGGGRVLISLLTLFVSYKINCVVVPVAPFAQLCLSCCPPTPPTAKYYQPFCLPLSSPGLHLRLRIFCQGKLDHPQFYVCFCSRATIDPQPSPLRARHVIALCAFLLFASTRCLSSSSSASILDVWDVVGRDPLICFS